MGWYEEFRKTLGAAAGQLTNSGHVMPHTKPDSRVIHYSRVIHFTTNFQEKAKAWGLSEKDALDVYYHGEETTPGRKTRKYNGYELSILLWAK